MRPWPTMLLCGVLFISLLALAPRLAAGGCETEADCSYFGRCVAGRCVCRHQYNGTNCDAFAFAPVDPTRGSGLRTVDATTGQQTSSWGGSVLLDENGTYHMFAAEMTNSVGIKSWRSNSRVGEKTAATCTVVLTSALALHPTHLLLAMTMIMTPMLHNAMRGRAQCTRRRRPRPPAPGGGLGLETGRSRGATSPSRSLPTSRPSAARPRASGSCSSRPTPAKCRAASARCP